MIKQFFSKIFNFKKLNGKGSKWAKWKFLVLLI